MRMEKTVVACLLYTSVEYVKLDDEGNQVEILLNGTEKDLDVKQQGEVLFARAYDNGKLRKNGTLIRRGCI